MGDKFTEGAIVQHLAKLRIRLEDLAKDVPPPLRRGAVTKEHCTVYKPKKGGKPPPRLLEGLIIDRPSVLYNNAPTQPKTGEVAKKDRINKVKEEAFSDDEDDGIMEDLYDSDDDYGPKKKKSKKTPKQPTRSSIKLELDSSPPNVKLRAIARSHSKKPMSTPKKTAIKRKDSIITNDTIESIKENKSPATHTHGIKSSDQGPEPRKLDSAIRSNSITMTAGSYETSLSESDSDIPVSPRTKVNKHRQLKLATQVSLELSYTYQHH